MSNSNNYAPLTQNGVEREITRLSGLMEEGVEELDRVSSDAAVAEADFKIRYAQERIKAKVQAGGKITVSDADDAATVETETELRRRLVTEAKKEVGQERMRTLRARIDALRTVSANIRAQT